MTAAGGLLSDSAVKPRRSANSSAAWMVSPMSRRKRTGQHPRGAAPAEIGLERRRQRGARRQRGERRRGEARGLAQRVGLTVRERTRPDPAERRPVRLAARRRLRARRRPQAPASQRRPASSPGLAAPWPRACRHEPQRLDHLPARGPPQPGAPRDQRVRHGQSVRAPPASGRPSATRRAPSSASSRSAPGVSPAASTSQDERRRQLHGPIMRLTPLPLSRVIVAWRAIRAAATGDSDD